MLENNQQKTPILIQDLEMQYPTAMSKHKKRYGIYRCECGNEFRARTADVKSGNTQSCGCYSRQRTSERSTTHGLRYHPLYKIWKNMIDRTLNHKNKSFKSYGARGITVCERWLDIKIFIEDMSPTYQKGLTIDRIDNDGNYEPSNCRWTTQSVQQRNTRKIQSNNTSGYRGVYWDRNKWAAQIKVDSKKKYLGCFNTAIEAAKAYDNYVIINNLEHTKNFDIIQQMCRNAFEECSYTAVSCFKHGGRLAQVVFTLSDMGARIVKSPIPSFL